MEEELSKVLVKKDTENVRKHRKKK